MIDFAAINNAALGALLPLLRRWLPDGKVSGREYVALNPRRDDHHLGSFGINLRTGKWGDFATGDRGGDIVSLHAYLLGCSQSVAARHLGAPELRTGGLGYLKRTLRDLEWRSATPFDDQNRKQIALLIWNKSSALTGTLAADYLASRNLHLPQTAMLRFHRGLLHYPTGTTWPALIALVTRADTGVPLAIHRTYLDRGGSGKAPVAPNKMMLGRCRGGVVRLSPAPAGDDELLIGEGLETCLSAMQVTGRPAWAALSTSGLRALDLPSGVRKVIVLADGDAAGEAAARECARRWKREGRQVRIARPPSGQDFNDMLVGRAPPTAEAA
jgi:hypothetical protein